VKKQSGLHRDPLRAERWRSGRTVANLLGCRAHESTSRKRFIPIHLLAETDHHSPATMAERMLGRNVEETREDIISENHRAE
jgi:hypothetical protein